MKRAFFLALISLLFVTLSGARADENFNLPEDSFDPMHDDDRDDRQAARERDERARRMRELQEHLQDVKAAENSKPKSNARDNGTDAFDKKRRADFGDNFDGSKFQAPTFIDTDFTKHSFNDMLDGDVIPKDKPDFRTELDLLEPPDEMDSVEDDPYDARDKMRDKRTAKEWHALRAVDFDLLQDWVPGDPDRVHNGGFGLEKDNGRPVPYKLNGWIEIERGLPWSK